MQPALRILLQLKLRGVLRRILRNARTLRGGILFLFGLLMFGMWLIPNLLNLKDQPAVDLATPRRLVPMAILAYCLSSLLMSNRDRSVNFTPADVDFLFAGPFARRELLLYKICSTLVGTLFGSLIMSLVALRILPWWPSAFAGILLALFFIQLFSICLSLAIQSVTDRAYTRTRRLLLTIAALGTIAVITSVVRREPLESMTATLLSIRDYRVVDIGLRPLDIYGQLMTATSWGGLVVWTGAALCLNGAMLAFVLWIDTNFYEASVATSQRTFRRLQQRQRTGGAWSPRVGAKWTIPSFPFLGGIGPIAWKQSTSLFRRAHGLLFMLVVLGLICVPIVMAQSNQPGGQFIAIVANMLVLMTFISAQSLTYDYRGDIEFMDWLKGLPLSSLAISAGQLAVPVFMMTLIHWSFLATVAARASNPPQSLSWIAAFVIPFNVLYFALENMLFLLFPSRLVSTTPGDFQFFGRNMVMLFVKLLLIFMMAAIACGVGYLTYIIAGHLPLVFPVATWIAALGISLAAIPLVARSFRRFDMSARGPL